MIIGVRDFKSCDEPEAKLYVNDLPGLSLKGAANITPEQFQSGAEFLRNCNIMAARHVFNDFSKEIQQYFDFRNIVESRDLKVFSSTYNAMSDTERGLFIRRWRSEAARLYVEHVYIKVKQSGTATIKVIDGCETTEYTAELVADCINEVRLDYKAEEESIKIVFNQNLFETLECSYSKSGASCNTCAGGSNKNIYVTGWDGAAESSRCYGMGVKVHVQCYEENILCSLIPKMYFLMWYRAGIEVLRERLASNRINHITIFGEEKAQALMKEYQEEYKTNYNILVKGAYQFLKSTKGECIQCNNIRYVQSTP